MMRPASRERGFTLLEILLALVLLAFVMVGVWGAIRGATRITHSADAAMTQSEAVRTTQHFLRTWLPSAQPLPFTTDAKSPAQQFTGTASMLRYVGTLPLQAGHAGLYVQTLELKKADDGSVALWLSYVPYTGSEPNTAKPIEHRLLGGLHGGHFQYLGTFKPNSSAKWQDAWRDARGVPIAVRVTLDPAWRPRVAFPQMVIPLPLGNGFGGAVGGMR